jgi:hypothetical protein
MASVDAQLDRARKSELLDLALRNPLISYRILKSSVESFHTRAAASRSKGRGCLFIYSFQDFCKI